MSEKSDAILVADVLDGRREAFSELVRRHQHYAYLFEVFDFPLVQGDAPTLLRQPYSVLITESAAPRYFGDADPIGKIVIPENRPLRADYTSVGVLRDLPETAFFRFNFDFLTLTMTPINATGWDTWRPTQFPSSTPISCCPQATMPKSWSSSYPTLWRAIWAQKSPPATPSISSPSPGSTSIPKPITALSGPSTAISRKFT